MGYDECEFTTSSAIPAFFPCPDPANFAPAT